MHTPQQERDFAKLLERYQPTIDSICLRCCGGDVFYFHELRQECALSIWMEVSQHGTSRFRGESSEATWIGSIARHAISRYLRNPNNQKLESTSNINTFDMPHNTDGQNESNLIGELSAHLNSRERILMAHYLDGDSYSTIARTEGITESTARKRMERLIKKLKTIINR